MQAISLSHSSGFPVGLLQGVGALHYLGSLDMTEPFETFVLVLQALLSTKGQKTLAPYTQQNRMACYGFCSLRAERQRPEMNTCMPLRSKPFFSDCAL